MIIQYACKTASNTELQATLAVLVASCCPIWNTYGQGPTRPRASCTPTTGAKHNLSFIRFSSRTASPFHRRCCTPGHATYVAVVLGASSPPCVLYARWRLLCEGRRQQRWVAVPPATSFHAVPSATLLLLPLLLPLFSLSLLFQFLLIASLPRRCCRPLLSTRLSGNVIAMNAYASISCRQVKKLPCAPLKRISTVASMTTSCSTAAHQSPPPVFS